MLLVRPRADCLQILLRRVFCRKVRQVIVLWTWRPYSLGDPGVTSRPPQSSSWVPCSLPLTLACMPLKSRKRKPLELCSHIPVALLALELECHHLNPEELKIWFEESIWDLPFLMFMILFWSLVFELCMNSYHNSEDL